MAYLRMVRKRWSTGGDSFVIFRNHSLVNATKLVVSDLKWVMTRELVGAVLVIGACFCMSSRDCICRHCFEVRVLPWVDSYQSFR